MSEHLPPVKIRDEASIARMQFVRQLADGAHIHISGICGKGTAAVLSLLKDLGFRVTGSDKAFYPPMGDVVHSQADKVYVGFSPDNIEERPDLVVIGNALSRDNREVKAVIEQGLSVASMPEVFEALLIGSRDVCSTSVVVTGTHGKTTTSAATTFVLEAAGRKPGYFIGGMPHDLPGGIRSVSQELPLAQRAVVLEGDEYDSAFFAKYSKFHCYRPDIAVITSLEFDHADIFETIEDIEAEFTRFVARVPEDGLILVCDTSERLDDLVERWQRDDSIKASIERYGLRETSEHQLSKREPWCYQEIPKKRFGQMLSLRLETLDLEAGTMLSGEHNGLNLLAAAVVARRLGVGEGDIIEGIGAFRGVGRRQHVLLENDSYLVIEDFAHHPTEVRYTLNGIKEMYPKRRLLAVFEPRSNTSRRSFFQDEYVECFNAADVVIIKEVEDAGGYSGTGTEIVALDVQRIVEQIAADGKRAASFLTVDGIESHVLSNVSPGDVIVVMSNGEFGGLQHALADALR